MRVEVDVTKEELAKLRLAGVKVLKMSSWDVLEDVVDEYIKVFHDNWRLGNGEGGAIFEMISSKVAEHQLNKK